MKFQGEAYKVVKTWNTLSKIAMCLLSILLMHIFFSCSCKISYFQFLRSIFIYVHVCVCSCALVPAEARVGHWVPGDGVRAGCGTPSVGAKTGMQFLRESSKCLEPLSCQSSRKFDIFWGNSSGCETLIRKAFIFQQDNKTLNSA